MFPSSELGFLLEDYGQPGGVLGAEPADHLAAFSGDLSRFLRYSSLKVGARCASSHLRARASCCRMSVLVDTTAHGNTPARLIGQAGRLQ